MKGKPINKSIYYPMVNLINKAILTPIIQQ